MRKYLLGLAILGMIGVVSAFPASIQVVDRTATVDDPAEFQVQVRNNFANQRTFRISSVSSPPPTGSWFGYGNGRKVAPGETANISIMVTPPETAIQQNYGFDVNVRTIEGGNREKLSSYFSVNSQNDIKIISTAVKSRSFQPGDRITSNMTIFNTASSPLNYKVEATAMNETSSESGAMVSGSEKKHSFSFKVPKGTPPGNYQLQMAVLREGERRQSITQSFEVVSLEDVYFNSKENDRVFEYYESLYATNQGNSEIEVELNKTLPGYLTPLTSFNESADRTQEITGGTKYYWTFDTEPGETVAVSYRIRYWPPLVIFSVIVAGIITLKRLYTGIEFTKKVRRTDEGIKVHIEIENRSSHKVNDLKITDFVPDIASVTEEFPMAKPVIRKTSNGTRLAWEIKSMDAREQRVFEYTIKPLVEVEGGVDLPEAELEVEERRVAETDEAKVEFRPE